MSTSKKDDTNDIDEILEELGLNYEHKDHKKDCLAGEVYREYRAKLEHLIAQETNKAVVAELMETRSFGNPHDYIEARIKTLTADKEQTP